MQISLIVYQWLNWLPRVNDVAYIENWKKFLFLCLVVPISHSPLPLLLPKLSILSSTKVNHKKKKKSNWINSIVTRARHPQVLAIWSCWKPEVTLRGRKRLRGAAQESLKEPKLDLENSVQPVFGAIYQIPLDPSLYYPFFMAFLPSFHSLNN